MTKKVSIIIPTRNEELFIINTLNSIMDQDYPGNLVEVIIADGESDDNTRDLIETYIINHPNVRLINNPERVVPYALNYAIKIADGDVIVRLDAHSKYPKNYVSRLVTELENTKADNVGGVWITTPANKGIIATSIALATSHPLGIGDASYRLENLGVKEVDTVPFGCFPKEVFDRIGLFDTDLIRNQDDEFNGRIIKNGGKIFLIPDVEIEYYARASVSTMMKMFFQYGLFKPLVNVKLGSAATLRQFVPPVFVLFLLFGLVVPFLPQLLMISYLVGLSFYILISVFVGVKIALDNNRFSLLIVIPWLFPLIHISYGWGYIKGFVSVNLLNRKPGVQNFATSR